MMIRSFGSFPTPPAPNSSGRERKEAPRVEIPTAVKLYDMSPFWWPEPWDGTLPPGVHGLA
ncbi:MAG: hypothetical protein HY319_11340 [Armatimonadetes bacterium]|nr:hypothetical protein [Armatimonadota bacterium]